MKGFFFYFVFILNSLNAQVLFREAEPFERQEIQNSIMTIYMEQLMQAGLLKDEKAEREAVIMECNQEQGDEFYYYLTSEDGKLQYGYFAFFTKDGYAYIDAIYLEKKYRGQGFGKQTLQYFENYLLEKGIKLVKLYVFDHNKIAIELYNKMGYKIETTYYIDDKLIGHHMKKDLCTEKSTLPEFTFKFAEEGDTKLIHDWLFQEHIQQWMHGVGLNNTLTGLEKFFHGCSDTTYWIGYCQDTPFAFLITSPDGTDAITLDVFICDLDYLGKGLSVPMIRKFLGSQFSSMKRVLIDPECTNERAIHVYKKAGFKIIGEFIASWHPVPHYQMELYMKDLLEIEE